jgi:hypothetical protein
VPTLALQLLQLLADRISNPHQSGFFSKAPDHITASKHTLISLYKSFRFTHAHSQALSTVSHSRCICHCKAALQAHHRTAAASATAKQLCKRITAQPLHLPLQKQLCKRITAQPLHLPLQSSPASAPPHSRCICHYKAALQAHHYIAAASATTKQLYKRTTAQKLHLPLQKQLCERITASASTTC